MSGGYVQGIQAIYRQCNHIQIMTPFFFFFNTVKLSNSLLQDIVEIESIVGANSHRTFPTLTEWSRYNFCLRKSLNSWLSEGKKKYSWK